MTLNKKNDIIILGIETSCDDTAVGIIKNNEILADYIYSQKVHAEYGGVVPEIAGRSHVERLMPIVIKAFSTSNLNKNDIDYVAATSKPGLLPAVLTGLSFARAFAYGLNVPLIEINHIEAHICINEFYNQIIPPYLALVVSGGHTLIYKVEKNNFCELDSTVDDAMGEVFDKIGRELGINYPAGAEINKRAELGNNVYKLLKKPTKQGVPLSFSGIKSATVNFLQNLKVTNLTNEIINDLCCSFNNLTVDTILNRCALYVDKINFGGTRTFAICGGVAANTILREKAKIFCKKNNLNLAVPPIKHCVDNGIMIAFRALKIIKNNNENI